MGRELPLRIRCGRLCSRAVGSLCPPWRRVRRHREPGYAWSHCKNPTEMQTDAVRRLWEEMGEIFYMYRTCTVPGQSHSLSDLVSPLFLRSFLFPFLPLPPHPLAFFSPSLPSLPSPPNGYLESTFCCPSFISKLLDVVPSLAILPSPSFFLHPIVLLSLFRLRSRF